MSRKHEKRVAAEAAAELVETDMTVGLGSGSTVAHLLEILGRRNIHIRCVSTSQRTDRNALRLGLHTEHFKSVERLDLAIDGADLIAPDFWLVKGGGGAHTREKVVAAAADRFVVIADSSKPVERLHSPVPIELLRFGLAATLARLGPVTLRDVPESPDGGLIADWTGELTDPALLAATLSAEPGVIEHGLFPGPMVSDVVIGRESGADWLERR
jgi:ribose 5-phosphate isomerase A